MAAIGPLTAAAADDAVALWGAAGLLRPWNDPVADLMRALACPSSDVLGARDAAGALVATVMVGYDGHRGWIYYLAVASHVRRQGIGRAMMAAAEAWLVAVGAPKVQLMVRGDNIAPREFYAGIGYGAEDVVVLSRRLAQ